MSVNPRIDTIGAWIAAGVRQTIPMSELSTVFPEIYQKVARAVLAADGHLRGPAYGCYFGMPTDTVDVEIGFGIDRELELPGITVTAWPEAQAVVGTHIGPYDDLARSYEELGAWMSAQDVPLADHMWEFYDSPPDTDPAETVTRMVFPLKP